MVLVVLEAFWCHVKLIYLVLQIMEIISSVIVYFYEGVLKQGEPL